MKKYFILFLTILWGAVSFAQNLTVKDNVTQQPLEFVTIYSIAGNHSTVTNVRGQADVSDLMATEIFLSASLAIKAAR